MRAGGAAGTNTVEGGDHLHATDHAGGDSGAAGTQAAKREQPPNVGPATRHSSGLIARCGWWRTASRRCRPGTCPAPRPSGAICESPMGPRATARGGLGGGTGSSGDRRGPFPGGAAQFEILDKDPMDRRAVCLAAGRRVRGASRDVSPTERRCSRFSTKTLRNAAPWGCRRGRGAAPGDVLRQSGAIANFDKDPTERRAVGWWLDRRPGCGRAAVLGRSSAIREFPTRPYGTSRGGVVAGVGAAGAVVEAPFLGGGRDS